MFSRSLKSQLREIQGKLSEIFRILQKLSRGPKSGPGSKSIIPVPLSPLLAAVSSFQREVAYLRNQNLRGSAVPRAQRDLHMSYNSLRLMAQMNISPLTKPRGAFQDHRNPLHLEKALSELEREIKNLKVPETKFQRQLRKMIGKSGLTVYGLAAMSGIHSSYLGRLLSGERGNPSCDVVQELTNALAESSNEITKQDMVSLVEFAGYSLPKIHRT